MLAPVKPNLLRKPKKLKSQDRWKQKHLGLNEDELKSFRTLFGQLLWVWNQTCPHISFDLSELDSSVNYVTVEYDLSGNKVLKMPKQNQSL